MRASSKALGQSEYRALASFRFQLRRFLRFSEQAAHAAGIEPHQHQLLLALKGLSSSSGASVGQVAEWLQIHHHSAVELVDRAAGRGLVERRPDTNDRRRVLVHLTRRGEGVLADLSHQHWTELRSAAPDLLAALQALAFQTGAGDASRHSNEGH